MTRLIRELEQDRNLYRDKCMSSNQDLTQAREEAESKSQQLKILEQRQRELETDRELLEKKFDESRSQSKAATNQCDELRRHAQDAVERQLAAETARARAGRQLRELRDSERQQRDGVRKPHVDRSSRDINSAEGRLGISGSGSPSSNGGSGGCPGGAQGAQVPNVHHVTSPGTVASTGGSPEPHSSLSPNLTQLSPKLLEPLSELTAKLTDAASKPRVLITGATGLLGRQMMKVVSEDWEVRGLGLKRAWSPIVACGLTEEGAAARQVEEFRPHVVIHLAAERRHEVLCKSSAMARQLNVTATSALATASERHGAWFFFVSTDQVFDGTSAPYSTKVTPNPQSEHGNQKHQAEQVVLAASPTAAILRVPVLYGPVENLSESSVTSLCLDVQNGLSKVDNSHVRFPTWAADVANVVRTMIDLHCNGTALSGFFHWQARERFTTYEMARLVAEVGEIDATAVVPYNARPAAKPESRQLDCSRLEAIIGKGKFQTPFRVGLAVCLAPFKDHSNIVHDMLHTSES